VHLLHHQKHFNDGWARRSDKEAATKTVRIRQNSQKRPYNHISNNEMFSLISQIRKWIEINNILIIHSIPHKKQLFA
jgi:hypothetical protein